MLLEYLHQGRTGGVERNRASPFFLRASPGVLFSFA
jgi:hypothetical protein